ncbi:LysR family transcriptional regulator [Demequina pelophila]|uniref:LysR family transcriptional regulator n=1 Tax=Demequina pelophila TaxID=1638984 RepID=UPI0007856418|nr:LysR family transcriptional regulator [Demequina pelophila]
MIDVSRLEVLVTLAREGSVTAAADELHLSQPTVSHHLRRLEAETGATLVTRVGRGVRLTEAGERLARRGEEILGLLSVADAELAAATSLQTGTVRLAVFPSGVATLGPRILGELAERHPGLSLDLREAEPPEAEKLLLAGEVDLAIAFRYPQQESTSAVNVEVMGEDPLYLVTAAGPGAAGAAGADGAEAGAAPAGQRAVGTMPAVTIPELARFADDTWMAGCERCRGYLMSTCERAGFEPRIAFASDDYVAAQALIAVGHGVTVLPRMALAAHRHPGVALTPVEGASRAITLLTLGRPPLPPALAAVAEIAREACSGTVV